MKCAKREGMDIHKKNKTHQSNRGFTLIELLVVIAVLAVMSAVAIPAINTWIPNYKLKVAAREMFTDFQYARSQALKRNARVAISFTTVTFPATGGGYVVFVDDGAGGGTAGNLTQDGDEATLIEKAMPELCSLTSANFNGGVATGYSARGIPLRNGSNMLTGETIIRNNKSNWYRIGLSNSGYPRIQKSSDGSTWE